MNIYQSLLCNCFSWCSSSISSIFTLILANGPILLNECNAWNNLYSRQNWHMFRFYKHESGWISYRKYSHYSHVCALQLLLNDRTGNRIKPTNVLSLSSSPNLDQSECPAWTKINQFSSIENIIRKLINFFFVRTGIVFRTAICLYHINLFLGVSSQSRYL